MITLKAYVMKKIPVPGLDYSSQEYAMEAKVELSGDSLNDLTEKVNSLYDTLEACIHERLGLDNQPAQSSRTSPPASRFRVPTNGNANAKRTQAGATQSQVKAIYAISHAIGMDKASLEEQLRDSFGVTRPHDLSIKQASSVIEELDRIQKAAG